MGSTTCDGLGRIQREPADEDSQPAEDLLLPGGQEPVTPGDGIAHGLVPSRCVTRPSDEVRQTSIKSFTQHRRSEHPDPRGGQFDGQRQPVEAAADLGDIRQ